MDGHASDFLRLCLVTVGTSMALRCQPPELLFEVCFDHGMAQVVAMEMLPGPRCSLLLLCTWGHVEMTPPTVYSSPLQTTRVR